MAGETHGFHPFDVDGTFPLPRSPLPLGLTPTTAGELTSEGRSEAFEVEQELNRPGQHKSDTVSILPLWIYEPRLYRVFPV